MNKKQQGTYTFNKKLIKKTKSKNHTKHIKILTTENYKTKQQ